MSGCGGCGSGYSGTGGGGGGGGGGIPGTVVLVAADTIEAGDIVALLGPGSGVVRADPELALSPVRYWVIGVATTSATAGNPVTIMTVPGQIVGVRCEVAPPASANGLPLWLADSATPGRGSNAPPALGSGNAMYRVGILVGADGASVTPTVLLQLDFVAAVP